MPTSWSWSFGDGDISTEQDPEHMYTLPGSYTVSLAAANSYGTGENTRTDYIVVNEADGAPVAGFTCSATEINEGETVQFTDQSGHYPSQWRWGFGDGGNSTLQNPEHTYELEGQYFVALSVHNSKGNDRLTKVKYIKVIGSGETVDTVSDFDGNVYATRKFGEQWWMAENLRTSHYPDGTEILYVESQTDWGALSITDEATCYPFESYGLENLYGTLYTWTAASTACPSGWHLPGDEEWIELEMYLGMSESEANSYNSRGTDEGSKLACLANLWRNGSLLSKSAFGSSGFMAFPAGIRDEEGWFIETGTNAAYWTSTKPEALEARARGIARLPKNTQVLFRGNPERWTLSALCQGLGF